jgi:transcriptional regulator with XRE-family HTH domain
MQSRAPKSPAGRPPSRVPRARRKGPDARDIEVGRRVRAFRLARNLSQSALANQLGLTFQQVQKYEKGTNRISAGRLQTIAEIFQVPVTDFFSAPAQTPQSQLSIFELVDSAGALRLLRAYTRLPAKMRQTLVQLAMQMAGDEKTSS